MGIDKKQLRELIDDILHGLNLYSPDSSALLMGTAAQESALGTYLKQKGNGPALGIFQMEPATERDIWENFLKYHNGLVDKLVTITGETGPGPHLRWNLAYQIAMTRIHYLRKTPLIPNNLIGQAEYWKHHYNTPLGKGTVEEYIKNYNKWVA